KKGVAPRRNIGVKEIVQLRGFGDEIDRTTGRPATGVGGGRPLRDFNLLEVEGVATVSAEIADAVDKEVIAGRKTANGNVIAGNPAALSGLDTDSGNIAKGVAQGRRSLVLHECFGDDLDGTRWDR